MNALETAIEQALLSEGSNQEANKAYLEFIKANFIIPIEKNDTDADEEPKVLFLKENEHVFLPVFTQKSHLDAWIGDACDAIQLLTLSGVDLLKGIGEDVIVSLNIGTPFYKEFNPAELARMRSMVLKLFK